MATSKFGSSWYVRRDRIQMFLPFRDNIDFEIDKTGLGKLSPDKDAVFAISIGGNSMNFGNNAVKAIIFTGSSENMKYLQIAGDGSESGGINQLINNVVYGAGSKCTINFWSFPIVPTDESNNIGVTNNMILADASAQGYAFGFDTHTSMMDPENVSKNDSDYKYHILTAIDSIKKIDGNESELGDYTEAPGETRFEIPIGNRWIMTTIVLDNSDSSNFKSTIHFRWIENGVVNHYWKSNIKMGTFNWEGGTVVNRSAGAWNIGCSQVTSGGEFVPSLFFTGGLRNLMLYNVALTTSQQNLIFSNGIDPYEIGDTSNTDTDEDQYDKRMWGKYGIIATRSNVNIERSLITKYTTAVNGYAMNDNSNSIEQNKKRFSLVARDSAKITVSRNDVNEGNFTNPEVGDTTNDKNKFLSNSSITGFTQSNYSLSVAAWRGGEITGDNKLDVRESRALWGGLINGISDMMEIDNNINPETLPSGKYITNWMKSGTTNVNYPTFLPKYYYRDRLGKSWRKYGSTVTDNNSDTGKYIQEIFWQDDIPRYEKIEWTKAKKYSDGTTGVGNSSSDEYQMDNAENWNPVFWTIAIYEIDRDPTMTYSNNGVTGFANHIKLVLISNDGRSSAIYHKYRRSSKMSSSVTDGAYGPWQFDSFNSQQNEYVSQSGQSEVDKLSQEFMRRIYLPHLTIPHLTIPLFREVIDVNPSLYNVGSKKDSAVFDDVLSKGGCSLVYYAARRETSFLHYASCGKMLVPNNDVNNPVKVVDVTYDGIYNTWTVPESGVYAFYRIGGSGNYEEYLKIVQDGTVSFEKPYYETLDGQLSGNEDFVMYVSPAKYFCYTGAGGLSTYTIFYAKRGVNIKFSLRRVWPEQNTNMKTGLCGFLLSPRTSHLGNNVVTGVNVTKTLIGGSGSSVTNDPRYTAYVKKDGSGREYIELANINAKYTKKNYASASGAAASHVDISATTTDITKSPYDE